MAITLNPNKILQNLRNTKVFDTKETAKEALTALAASLKAEHDGSINLARYTDGGTTKSLIGVYHHNDPKGSMTIYDPDANAAEVADLKSKLAAEVAARKLVDGVDADTYTANQLTEYLKGAANLKDADEKLDVAIKTNADAIKALNDTHDATVSEGNYVSGVHFNGGVLTVDQKDLVDAQDKVLAQDKGSIKSTITLVKVTEGLATNVREAYKLVGKDGVNALGATINVYKDSSLKTVKLGKTDAKIDTSTGEFTSEGTAQAHDALLFVYHQEDGKYSLVAIDVEQFLKESEFKNGLQVLGGEVSVLVDPTSEKYLTVGEAGVKVSGVDDAIKSSKVLVNAKNSGHVTVKVVNNPETGDAVTIEENDIASAQGLTSEIARATGAEQANANAITAEAASRKTVTGVDADTYAANQLTEYLKGAANLKDADEKLDAAIKANADAITKLDGEVVKTLTAGNGIEVTPGASNEKTVAVKLDSVKGNNILSNGTEGLYLGNVWDCGTFDFTV